MANNSQITRSSAPRVLMGSLDKIIDQNGKDYQSVGDRIFKTVNTEKAFYEWMQLTGVGMATEKDEGDSIQWDSIDQHWVFRPAVKTFSKSVRITREMLKDNQYENMLPRIAREQLKALMHARDYNMCNVLNRATTSGVLYGDGKVLAANDHPLQAGGTNSNIAAVSADLSEDALETLVLLIDAFKNDDGLVSQYAPTRLIVPSALRFEAYRVLGGTERPGTADRDINVMNRQGTIPEIVVWKRLSDSDAYTVQTDADEGLVLVRREGIFTDSMQDFDTYDTKVTAAERYLPTVGDHRAIAYNPGA